MAHSSLAIANEFISRASIAGGALTHMQVQKFVYLSHGFHLASADLPLVVEHIEAWPFGPVIRRLYDALKRWGADSIPRLIQWGDDFPFGHSMPAAPLQDMLSNSETHVIEEVWRTYGTFSAFKLSALTHEPGTPWSETFRSGQNSIIENWRIQNYFKGL